MKLYTRGALGKIKKAAPVTGTVTETDPGEMFSPAPQPVEDTGEQERTSALASHLHAFAHDKATRYEVSYPAVGLENGWYQPQRFPSVAMLVRDGKVVEVRGDGNEAFDFVASMSDTSGSSDATLRNLKGFPERVSPVRLGSEYLMSPQASGLEPAAMFVRPIPGPMVNEIAKRKGSLFGNVITPTAGEFQYGQA